MISIKTITGAWSAITTAGQSGTCWVEATNQYIGDGTILITHSPTTPASDTIAYYTLLPSDENNEFLHITADTAQDIFWARTATPGALVSLKVDVV